MNPIPLAGPAVEPITLADAKAYLRLDGGDEDELVGALIAAGRLSVERATRLVLGEQRWRYRLDRWPAGRAVALPLAPVIAVEAVRVTDSGGAVTTAAAADLRLDDAADPARLLVAASLPEPGSAGGGIAIDLLCGFGASAAAVPEPLRLAVRRLVAHWFEHRGDDPPVAAGLPADVRALLAAFVRPRLAR